tara:strand:- start:1138 stop:1353 length:216 start_codon:yes stop_codon:yes gene_type:complete
MTKKTLQKQKEISEKEIESFFEEVNRSGRIFSPTPNPEHKDLMSDWVTTSGSSKQSNKLVKVSTWQTGQAS